VLTKQGQWVNRCTRRGRRDDNVDAFAEGIRLAVREMNNPIFAKVCEARSRKVNRWVEATGIVGELAATHAPNVCKGKSCGEG